MYPIKRCYHFKKVKKRLATGFVVERHIYIVSQKSSHL